MATNIPPHNLEETINAAVAIVDNPELADKDRIDELIEKCNLLGPDFPTGGIIIGNDNLKQGLNELSFILDQLELLSISSLLEFDISLARGLNYYTGSIFEVISLKNNTGSLAGGGRYDELTKEFGYN